MRVREGDAAVTAATVLLTFPESRDAARFVRALYSDAPSYADIGGAAYSGDVAATVFRPTEWCTCAGQQEPSGGRRKRGRPKRELGWTKDPKTGWFVCVHCGNPSKAMVVHAISAMLVGAVDHTPAILKTGPPRTLFDQRVEEVLAQAIREGQEADVESLTSHERQYLRDNPESVGDPRHGNTALNGGGQSRRSTKQRRAAHPRRQA